MIQLYEMKTSMNQKTLKMYMVAVLLDQVLNAFLP